MVDPDRIVERARQVPGVVDVTSRGIPEVATYLPGRRVRGVRFDDGRVEVHIVARADRPVFETADEVRKALRPLVGDAVVDVVVEDIDFTNLIDLREPVTAT